MWTETRNLCSHIDLHTHASSAFDDCYDDDDDDDVNAP